MARKIKLTEKGDPSELPKLIRANWHLVCARCKDTLGGHLGYRCPDDKGTFQSSSMDVP